MKKAITVVICIGIILLLGFVYARQTSTLFNLLFQPSDMFVSLAAKDADLAMPGQKILLSFQPKYPGTHDVDLEVEKLDFGLMAFKGKQLLEVIVRNNKNKIIAAQKVTEPASSFLGTEKKGFVLLSFMVPDQMRIGEKGTVEITVQTPDSAFSGIYGSTRFAVNKGSDK